MSRITVLVESNEQWDKWRRESQEVFNKHLEKLENEELYGILFFRGYKHIRSVLSGVNVILVDEKGEFRIEEFNKEYNRDIMWRVIP